MGNTGIVIRVERLKAGDARGQAGQVVFDARWEQFATAPPRQDLVQAGVQVPVYIDADDSVTDGELRRLDVRGIASDLVGQTLTNLLQPSALGTAAPIDRSAPVGSANNPRDVSRNPAGQF